jgi:hypothetical protein
VKRAANLTGMRSSLRLTLVMIVNPLLTRLNNSKRQSNERTRGGVGNPLKQNWPEAQGTRRSNLIVIRDVLHIYIFFS